MFVMLELLNGDPFAIQPQFVQCVEFRHAAKGGSYITLGGEAHAVKGTVQEVVAKLEGKEEPDGE